MQNKLKVSWNDSWVQRMNGRWKLQDNRLQAGSIWVYCRCVHPAAHGLEQFCANRFRWTRSPLLLLLLWTNLLKPPETIGSHLCNIFRLSLSLYIIIYISLYIHIYLNWLIETVPILSHGRCSWRTSTVVNHPTKWESCGAQKFGVDHFKTSRGVSHIGFETLHLGTADHKIKEVKWQKLKSQKL